MRFSEERRNEVEGNKIIFVADPVGFLFEPAFMVSLVMTCISSLLYLHKSSH